MKSHSVHFIRIAILACAASLLLGGVNPSKRPKALNNAILEYTNLDVNQLSCVIGSDGPYADYLKNNVAGMEWPKGSGKTCVYTAGLWIGAIRRQNDTIRMAVQDYQSEEQPGPFLPGEMYNTTTNKDSAWTARVGNPRYRLYKVKSNKPAGDPSVQADAWSDWPGDLGAPYVDANGNGQWDPGVDTPKFYGDEMLWCVINDCSVARHHSTSTSRPMGLEIQELFYAYNQSGALGNMMFMKWRIINKSDADYDSVYVGEWSDIDLGDGNDDLPACDTSLGLGYVYNGTNNDATYGTAPPADGLVFLEGPKVPAGPMDSALVDGAWYKGFRNLSQSGFVVYINSAGSFSDPPLGDGRFASIAYAYLQGKEGYSNQYQLSATTGQPTPFWLSGDPVSGTGDVPANFLGGKFASPQDIRIMNDCGPFTLAQGDTQEVVGAFVIARGTSNLNSITALRASVTVAREVFFNNGIVGVTRPPLAPLPAKFALEQNFPNPFNPTTGIRYQASGVSNVKLVVYDVLGREVATLVNEVKQPGSYSVTFDGSRLASGVYYYRLQVRPLDSAIGRDSKSGAGSFSETRKMVLIK